MTYTLPSNISSMPALMQSLNSMLGNDLVAIMTLVIIFVITYIASSTRMEMEKAVLFSSWVATVSAFFLSIIFNTSPNFVIIPMMMTALSVILTWRR